MSTLFAFSNNTTPTGPQLDAVLAQLAASTVIPCTMTGSSNTLVMAPLSSAPTFAGYSQGQVFVATSSAFTLGATTMQVGTFAALNVYRDSETGPQALIGGELAVGNAAFFMYDAALNNSAGGFHLINPTPTMSLSLTTIVNKNSGAGPSDGFNATAIIGGVTRQGIIDRTGTIGGGFNDTTDTAANIVGSMPGAIATATTFRFRYFNDGTGQTGTLVGGTNVTIAGPATTVNDASHDFIGVVTEVSPTPSVTIWG